MNAPTTPDLSGVFAKLERAEFHIHSLREDVDAFLTRDPPPWSHRVETEQAAGEGTRYIVRAVIREPPRPRWALIIGDALQNLNSALDHLAWELTDPSAQAASTYFPVFEVESTFRKSKKVKKTVEGFYAEHRAFVEASQPYLWSQPPPLHPLALLRRLANIDKHRVLVTPTTAVGHPWIGTNHARPRIERIETGPLSHDTEIMRFIVPVGDSGQAAEVETGLTFQVGLENDVLHRPAVEVLMGIRGYMRMTIEAYFTTGLLPDGTR
jgi:hypothetical protein